MTMEIREAKPSDAELILKIYSHYVTDTCVSFETEVPSIEEFASRIENTIKSYPYLVCEIDEKIVGYAYGSKYREREAYRYSAEVSVYVVPEYHRRGIGRALYAKLFELLKEQGIYTAYAGITVPNYNSVGLHKAMGFREVGIYKNVGYKFGTWLSSLWVEKPLRAYDNPIAKRGDMTGKQGDIRFV